MTQIDRVLCPVDFSDASQAAFDYAQSFAQATQAELWIAHAFDRPASLDLAGQKTPADKSLRQRLEQLRPRAPEIRFQHLLHAGPAGEVICWLAQEHHCDLIMMGTHGRSGLQHLLFGSAAEYVLRHARCPVLTVRPRPQNEPPLREPMVLPLPAPRMM